MIQSEDTPDLPSDAYVCPRCHSGFTPQATGRLACSNCGESYPVAGGVPYLIFKGSNWYSKVRELVLYHDLYQKIKTGRLERDRFAGKEQDAQVNFGYMRHYFDLARSEIDFSTRPRILDVGAGCGEVSQRLAEAGADTYAVDINLFDLHHDLRLVSFADQKDFDYNRVFRGVPIEHPFFKRAIADADHLPFADGFFDYVVMRATAHHVVDLPRFFSEISRVLRPGGRLILITEPLASVLDNISEYTAEDVDWQEGMMENRPTWPQYSSALKEAGFGELTVRCFHAGFGFRLSRLIQRLRLRLSLESIWEKRLSGWKLTGLPFVAGAMNLYAVKKREASVYRVPSVTESGDAGAPSVADLLVTMGHDIEPARKVLRQYFPADQLRRHHNLAAETDRDTLRGARGVEEIAGRTGRYLLTEFFCLLDARPPATHVGLEYNADQLRGQESPRVLLSLNGRPIPLKLEIGGWQTVMIPIPADRAGTLELRLQQPDLIRRTFSDASPERRDVGVALRRVWVEG